MNESCENKLIRWKYWWNNHLPDFRPFAVPPRWMWWKRWWRRWARAAEQVSTGQDYHNCIISWWNHNILTKGLEKLEYQKSVIKNSVSIFKTTISTCKIYWQGHTCPDDNIQTDSFWTFEHFQKSYSINWQYCLTGKARHSKS